MRRSLIVVRLDYRSQKIEPRLRKQHFHAIDDLAGQGRHTLLNDADRPQLRRRSAMSADKSSVSGRLDELGEQPF